MIAIQASLHCNPSSPQAFCSTLDNQSQRLCNSKPGTPVMCTNNFTISGFTLNDGSCGKIDGRLSLDFHSVAEFEEWIKEVSGAETSKKTSILFILLVISLRHFVM
jgi:hypothetical protein